MTDAEILAGIAAVAREHLNWSEELRPDMRLVEELRLDSIKLLTLAIEVENRFRVRLDEDEAAIETVGDLVAAIGERMEERSPGAGARGPAAAQPADSPQPAPDSRRPDVPRPPRTSEDAPRGTRDAEGNE